LTLVAILWYFVGRKIDSYRFAQDREHPRMSVGRIVANILAALYGMNLVVVIFLHNVIFTNPKYHNGGGSNFVGDVVYQSLWLLWSLVLIFIPGYTLALKTGDRNV
jgi:hypothetical protein